MSKFKIGDRVRDISISGYSFSHAGEGVISEVETDQDENPTGVYRVSLDNAPENYPQKIWSFEDYELEMVKPKSDGISFDVTYNISNTEEVTVTYKNVAHENIPDLLKAAKTVFPNMTSAVIVVSF